MFFHVFSVIVSKTTIWAHFSKISYEWQNKFVFRKLICLFLLISIGFLSIRYINNKIHPRGNHQSKNRWTDTETKEHFFGFNYPFEFKKYPNIKDVKQYTDFLNTQNKSPKEYILGLFEHYDIVVLQEHYHGESTQWDMIFDIVSDTAFINNVGNVFTEYGYVGQQYRVDKFLNTVFPNDTILEKETACLMYFMSGAFFYFVKNLNLLNSELPDSSKIKLHLCCAQIDCDDIVAFGKTKAKADMNRDSLMAQTTIDWYNEQTAAGKRNKCLVVTNYRHAFGYAGGVDYVKSQKVPNLLKKGNQGQYIWEQFPDNTAAVMQWHAPFLIPTTRPIHKGKWDLAIEINQNKPFGFDLKNSPFGLDHFDMYPLRGAKIKLKYEDIFTGMIFNKPHSEMKEVTHPYQQYALLRSIKEKNIDLEDPQNRLYLHYSQYYDDEAHLVKITDSSMSVETFISNFVPIAVYMLLSLISLLSLLFYFTGLAIKTKKTKL